MKLFIRQSFTQADKYQSCIIQDVLNLIEERFPEVCFLTGGNAASSHSFIKNFEMTTGLAFSPKVFRNYRLNLINECEAMVFIRTSMSESGAFELSYNLHTPHPKPVFYAHWKLAPIKTTLLRELDKDFPVTYCEFVDGKDIDKDFSAFVKYHKLSSRVPEQEDNLVTSL